jgi:acetylornithine/N-succinyldiaminopimelate aminotransferase
VKNLGGAYEIITTMNSFHGRTLATMSATGKTNWESLFAPKVPGFKHVPLNDIDSLLSAINQNTCAIMLETGIGRTGKLFAYEHYGIQADVMTLAKGIGGGFPLSAMLTKEEYNIFEVGDQGGTYSGQPLAMAVGLAVVKELIRRDLPLNAEIQGDYILERLHEIKETYKLKSIRGRGLLIAFDLSVRKSTDLVSECLQAGLLINSPNQMTIRLMPPLIVSREEVNLMLEILVRVMKKVLIEM